jgi:hypothetical protein
MEADKNVGSLIRLTMEDLIQHTSIYMLQVGNHTLRSEVEPSDHVNLVPLMTLPLYGSLPKRNCDLAHYPQL